MKTLNIIGGGRVGRSLAKLWHMRGTYVVQDVVTRSAQSADEAVQFIGAGRAVQQLQDMRAADVWMLSVPDGQIAALAGALAEHLKKLPSASSDVIAVQCSGALGSDLLATLRCVGCQLASAHCILSFSSPATAITQFAGTPCALEGDFKATESLSIAFEEIGAQPFALAADQKLLYHAAAVFATNFLPVLHVVAADLWRKTGMPPELITPLSATLLQNAVQNITTQGAAQALTGPAARGDTELVALQAKAVTAWNLQAGAAYEALSQLAAQIAKHGTINHNS